MTRLPTAPAQYDQRDQQTTRSEIERALVRNVLEPQVTGTVVDQDARDAAAAAQTTANTAASGSSAAQAAANTLSAYFDGSGTLLTGVDPDASVGGVEAALLRDSRGAVFLETFEQAPAWTLAGGTGAISLVAGAGQNGGNVLQAIADVYIAYPYNIPYDPTKLYRIRARIAQVTRADAAATFVGVVGVASDGVTLVNTVGADNFIGQHYAAVNGSVLDADGVYRVYTGWARDLGTPAPSADPRTPSPLHASVRYIRPALVLNWGTTNTGNVVRVDYLAVDVFDADAATRTYTALDADSRLTSQRRLRMVSVGNRHSAQSDVARNSLFGLPPLSTWWESGSATASIGVASHHLETADGAIAYGAGVVAGLSASTRYHLYTDDLDFAGGAMTYIATALFREVFGPDRYYLGYITTAGPTSAGGGGGGGGGAIDPPDEF